MISDVANRIRACFPTMFLRRPGLCNQLRLAVLPWRSAGMISAAEDPLPNPLVRFHTDRLPGYGGLCQSISTCPWPASDR
jgi:hypothetical protein